ncbi:MAG: MFS transporter, partial [Caulobacteraceae bacterium]
MADTTVNVAVNVPKATPMGLVVAASAASTSFEWYDFFIFGSLVQTIGRNFFAALGPTAGLAAALALFGVGFAFRPIGALVFGRIGDRLGRKSAFFICVTMMGLGTFCIGLLPTSAQIGAAAPALLIALRVLQGAALGGQYGGAAIYVAEHAPAHRRGYLTGWVQTSAALGLIAALAVIYATRRVLGEAAFESYGWRIPFFASAGLVAISIWMRLRLSESPAFAKLKAAGEASTAPLAEAFGRWSNLKLVLIAFFGLMSAQGAYWYTVFFYSQVFMEKFLKVGGDTTDMLAMVAAIVSAPLYVFFAWLSDKVGRKPVMWLGMALGLVTLFPGFMLMSSAANPALAAAAKRTPVVVAADPADCSWQFDVTGKARFVSSCDIAKAALANAGVGYANVAAPKGQVAMVRVGG